MNVEIQVIDDEFRKAFLEFAASSKKDMRTLLKDQAKLFVRDALKITPPNTGEWNRQGGEKAIAADLGKLFIGSKKKNTEVENEAEILRLHQQARNRRGRVRGRRAQKSARIADLRSATVTLKKRVGKLASGWNAAALRLGVRVPAWIMRHGIQRGSVELDFGRDEMRVILTNAVSYAGNIKGFERVIESTLRKRTSALRKQTAFFLQRAGRRKGFK